MNPSRALGLAKPILNRKGRNALMRGVKTPISVSRCRENPDCVAIFPPKFAAAKRALGGVDPCPEKWGARVGLGRLILITLVENLHRLRMRKGGNTKGGSVEVKSPSY